MLKLLIFHLLKDSFLKIVIEIIQYDFTMIFKLMFF